MRRRTIYGLVNPLAYALPLVAGSLIVTGEFRHRTIAQTFLSTPNRTVVLASKLAISVPVGLIFGIAGTAGILVGGAPVLAIQEGDTFLGSWTVWQVLLLSVVAMALWTVIGAAVGSVLTNQVATIVVILAFTQFLEPIARIAFMALDLDAVGKFLPGAAADGVVGASFFGGEGSDLLPRLAAIAVLLAYAALFAMIGRLTTFSRDLT